MAHRKLRVDDSEWDVWDVRPETRAQSIGNDLDNGWLCFQAGATRRRLHPIPPEWELASDSNLRSLFDQATEVAAARKVPGKATALEEFQMVAGREAMPSTGQGHKPER